MSLQPKVLKIIEEQLGVDPERGKAGIFIYR